MTERFNRLLETVKESSGCNDDLAGKTMDVLVEGKMRSLRDIYPEDSATTCLFTLRVTRI